MTAHSYNSKDSLKKQIDQISDKRLLKAVQKMIETHGYVSGDTFTEKELIKRANISEKQIKTGKLNKLETVMDKFSK